MRRVSAWRVPGLQPLALLAQPLGGGRSRSAGGTAVRHGDGGLVWSTWRPPDEGESPACSSHIAGTLTAGYIGVSRCCDLPPTLHGAAFRSRRPLAPRHLDDLDATRRGRPAGRGRAAPAGAQTAEERALLGAAASSRPGAARIAHRRSTGSSSARAAPPDRRATTSAAPVPGLRHKGTSTSTASRSGGDQS